MPRVLVPRRSARLRVDVSTHTRSGVLVKCCCCHYCGEADVVEIKSRRGGRRSMQRCPECKSLNIVPVVQVERARCAVFVQLQLFDD